MLEDWAFEACFTRLDAFDAWHRDGGASDRPAGEVFGLLAFRSPYRELLALGAVVDWTSGTPRLVGGDAPAFETHVSRAFAAHTFRHSWDQEAASWFQTGVGVNAVGRSPVIALAPNLLSLYPDAAAPVAGQVDEFRRRGWNAAAPPRSRALGALGLPTLPFASNPAGGVSKVGSAEPRVIIHVGWPNKALTIRLPPGFIGPPERYWDTNTLGGPTKPDPDDPYPLFLREFKSTIADAARNSCVLGHACYLGGLTSYEIALDFFKWFHQFFYKERDAWMMGNIAPSLEGSSGALRDALVPILNHVMAMGWRFASGVAQRVGNILVHELYRRFDAIEEKYRHLESPDVLRWLDARSRLPHDSYGRQDRLASVLIYTDDPKAEVASSPPGDPGGAAARAMRLIFELHSLVGPDGLRLILSKHSKWMCAAWTAWIGARFCGTLGLVWVAPDKALRADRALGDFVAGNLSHALMLPLLSFLSHLQPILAIHPYPLMTLWRAFNAHADSGAAESDVVAPNASSAAAARRWRSAVVNFPGSSMMAAAGRRPPPRSMPREWILRADACFDVVIDPTTGRVAAGAADPPGMGGHFFGALWTRPFSEEELQVWTTPVAEFAAAVVNLIVYQHHLAHALHIVLEIDALASPIALERCAKAPGLSEAHEIFLAEPVFKRFDLPCRTSVQALPCPPVHTSLIWRWQQARRLRQPRPIGAGGTALPTARLRTSLAAPAPRGGGFPRSRHRSPHGHPWERRGAPRRCCAWRGRISSPPRLLRSSLQAYPSPCLPGRTLRPLVWCLRRSPPPQGAYSRPRRAGWHRLSVHPPRRAGPATHTAFGLGRRRAGTSLLRRFTGWSAATIAATAIPVRAAALLRSRAVAGASRPPATSLLRSPRRAAPRRLPAPPLDTSTPRCGSSSSPSHRSGLLGPPALLASTPSTLLPPCAFARTRTARSRCRYAQHCGRPRAAAAPVHPAFGDGSRRGCRQPRRRGPRPPATLAARGPPPSLAPRVWSRLHVSGSRSRLAPRPTRRPSPPPFPAP